MRRRRRDGAGPLGHLVLILVGLAAVAAVLGVWPSRPPPGDEPSPPSLAPAPAPNDGVSAAPEPQDEPARDPPPIAGEACVAAWRATDLAETIRPLGGMTLGGGRHAAGEAPERRDRYACFGADDQGGRRYLEARYRGGDPWTADAWDVSLLCDEDGPSGAWGETAAQRCAAAFAPP